MNKWIIAAAVAVGVCIGLARDAGLKKSYSVPGPEATGYKIVANKARHTLELYKGKELLGAYKANFGKIAGDKEKEGDYKTPEGVFLVASLARIVPVKNIGSRWILLDTTNRAMEDYLLQYGSDGAERIESFEERYGAIITDADIKRFNSLYLKQPMWGGVGIHGGEYYQRSVGGNDRTQGCIALANEDVEELFGYLESPVTNEEKVAVMITP